MNESLDERKGKATVKYNEAKSKHYNLSRKRFPNHYKTITESTQ